MATLFSDITVRKEAELALQTSEKRQAFLLKLSDALRPLADSGKIKAAARVLGEQLGVDRAFYAEVVGEDWLVVDPYEHEVEPAAQGRHSMASFGQWIIDTLRAGENLVIRDLHTDARFELPSAQRMRHSTS